MFVQENPSHQKEQGAKINAARWLNLTNTVAPKEVTHRERGGHSTDRKLMFA